MCKQEVSLFSKCQNSLNGQVDGFKITERHWLAFIHKVKDVLAIVAAKITRELQIEVSLYGV